MKNNKQKTEIPKKKTNTIISFLIFFIVVQSFFAYENIINKLSQKFNSAILCFKSNDQLNENNKISPCKNCEDSRIKKEQCRKIRVVSVVS